MCFIISIIGLVLSFNFFMAENYMASTGAFVVALIFIILMARNIAYVKKVKKEKEERK